MSRVQCLSCSPQSTVERALIWSQSLSLVHRLNWTELTWTRKRRYLVTRPIQRRDLLCIDQLQTRERTGPLSSERVYSNGTVHIGVYRELQFSSGDVDKPLDACVYQGSMRQREALDIAPRGLYYAPHGLSAVSLLQPVRMSRSVARLQGNGPLIIVLYWSCHVARKRVGATSSGALYFARLRRASVFNFYWIGSNDDGRLYSLSHQPTTFIWLSWQHAATIYVRCEIFQVQSSSKVPERSTHYFWKYPNFHRPSTW